MEIVIGIFVIYIIYRIAKSLNPDKKPSKSEITVHVDISDSDGYRERSRKASRPPKEKRRSKPAKWHGWGQHVNIQGYNISDGLVYVGETLRGTDAYSADACLINPKLKLSPSESWEGDEEMGYWPQYAHISAKCRGAYLKWLANGRSEPEAYIGYVFLFFYGLERRLFIDGQNKGISENERSEIVNEVSRLLEIYGGNRSFRGYASNLLAMEWVLYQTNRPIPSYIDLDDRYCSVPFQVVLAQYVVGGNSIPAGIALQWVALHPEFGLRTPARRCAEEFRILFARRYQNKFGDGLIVKPNKTPLKLEYRAASPSLWVRLNTNHTPKLPNPFILKGPLKKLSVLVEECTVELEPYSRFLGRKGNLPNSLAALALLPRELMRLAPETEKMRCCLEQVCAAYPKLISLEFLYEAFGEKVPEKISKKEAENLSALVDGMGFGMVPDVRFHNAKPTPGGKLVIFPKGHGVDFQPSSEFYMVNTILRLGAMVSQVDQDISPEEEATLQRFIENNRELTRIEKESLMAFLFWSLRTPQGIAGIKQKLSEASNAEKSAISHILISVAHADGRIDPKEIKQLEKLYTTLGLDKKQVISDIHTLAVANAPVTVGLRDPESGFSIPCAVTEFSLNEALIKLREEETQQVKGVLENIFVDQVEGGYEQEDISPNALSADTLLAALDQAHQKLFNKLITQEAWDKASLHEICKELGLMADGAMEVLNEWAFDNVNAPLIEDGEPVYVDVDLAKELINA